MSAEVERTEEHRIALRRTWPNTMMFPRTLRDAIPDLPTCTGRVLEIDSFYGLHSNTRQLGPRVHAKFIVKETGKLSGVFEVRLDLDTEAVRALAETLRQLAEEAERTPPASVA